MKSKNMTKFGFITIALISFTVLSFRDIEQIIDIDYFGEILLPVEMEIQAGKYKEYSEDFAKKIHGNIDNHQKIVFQPKGLNQTNNYDFKTYARVVIDTYKGAKGTYKLLSNNINIGQEDIDAYNYNFQNQLETLWPKINNRLIKNNETKITTINGYFCTKHSYIRQLENSPTVYVEVYRVQNNDRVFLIQFSYREQDANKWKPIMEKVIMSIKLKAF
jgi:hypothetical protein